MLNSKKTVSWPKNAQAAEALSDLGLVPDLLHGHS